MKKVRSRQAAILVFNWVKQSFSPWVSLKIEKIKLKLKLKSLVLAVFDLRVWFLIHRYGYYENIVRIVTQVWNFACMVTIESW